MDRLTQPLHTRRRLPAFAELMNTLGESSLSKEMDAPKSLVCLTHIKRPFFVLPDELERMRERQYSGCGSAACGNPRVHSLFCVMTTEGVVLCESIRQKKKHTHVCVPPYGRFQKPTAGGSSNAKKTLPRGWLPLEDIDLYCFVDPRVSLFRISSVPRSASKRGCPSSV